MHEEKVEHLLKYSLDDNIGDHYAIGPTSLKMIQDMRMCVSGEVGLWEILCVKDI